MDSGNQVNAFRAAPSTVIASTRAPSPGNHAMNKQEADLSER